MIQTRFLVVIVLSIIEFSLAKSLFPANFEKCDLKASNFPECFKRSITNALKELHSAIPDAGLPNLAPLEIPSLVIGEGKGTVNVQQNFKNVKLYGLTNVTITEASVDFDKKIMFIKGIIPCIRKIGEYSIKGRILMLPIVGEGRSNITLVDMLASSTLKFKIVKKSGKEYMRIIENKTTLDPSRVIYELENLFNGDKMLGDNLLNVINENWKTVFEDVKTGYEGAFNDIIFTISAGFFGKVPLTDIFTNYL